MGRMVHGPSEPWATIPFQNATAEKTRGTLVPVTTSLLGLLKDDIATATGIGAAWIRGVVEYTRLTGASTAWTQGIKIYLDVSNNRLTKVATSNSYAGLAYEACADGATTGRILLNETVRA